ncbi:MAG TPA: hypothetical protein VEZ90_01855, partial [Blastocatellia bacterium]|nr:hypothetical protein [Blastocatellia bacterium]
MKRSSTRDALNSHLIEGNAPNQFEREIGVDRDRPVLGRVGASRIIDVLGRDMFAEFSAVRVPGTIAWCNFDLARSLGFSVGSNDEMTPELHEQ